MKNYEGYTERNPDDLERFYDEREWRYVPNQYEIGKSNIAFNEIIDEDEYTNWRGDINLPKPILSHRKLEFDLNDIEYVIVENKESKREILEFINANSSKFGSQIDCLDFASRIFNLENLQNDF